MALRALVEQRASSSRVIGPRQVHSRSACATAAAYRAVGLTAPCRNYHDPVIGYIAVVPEHRGHRYAYDLLAEATHLLVSEGADRIVADTDVTNTPMSATFAKARYPVTEHRIDFTY
jgi:RimJ/RimL family protein N-acetyltransferase